MSDYIKYMYREYLDTLDGSLAAGCIIRTAQLRIILRTAVGMETLRPALHTR